MPRKSKVTKTQQSKKPNHKGAASKLQAAMANSTTEGSADNNGVYFWRETDPEHGYLSQWYDCPFRDKDAPNKIYKTAEQ